MPGAKLSCLQETRVNWIHTCSVIFSYLQKASRTGTVVAKVEYVDLNEAYRDVVTHRSYDLPGTVDVSSVGLGIARGGDGAGVPGIVGASTGVCREIDPHQQQEKQLTTKILTNIISNKKNCS